MPHGEPRQLPLPLQKSFIVAQSATNLYSYGPAGMIGRSWYEEVVGRGNFAVEGDKLHLGPSIYKLIQLRRAHAEHERDLTFYRFLVAMTNKLLEGTGVQEPEMPLEEWLQQMRFSSTDDEKDGGSRRSDTRSSPTVPTSCGS